MIRLLASTPLLVSVRVPALADKMVTIGHLIEETRDLPHVSQRIDFISGKLLGVRYQGYTLIGGPKQPEKFVVRDDAFDCVTYCEVVLAAAMAQDLEDFETVLRRIRYDQGSVQYDRRNHYWADWCQRNVDNGICQPVAIEPSMSIDKTVTWHREFGKHHVSMKAIAKATLFDNVKLLAPGDIIGFISRRPGLDYYHTGLIAFSKSGELMLRHASLSHGRVVEEKMTTFAKANPVKSVTLLRAAENAPVEKRH